MLKMCKPRKPTKNNPDQYHNSAADFETLYEYCKQDVRAEEALSVALPPLTAEELEVWRLDQRINRRGVPIDLAMVYAACDVLAQLEARGARRMVELTGGEVARPTEVAKLTAWVRAQGVELEGLAKDEIDRLLAGDLPEGARTALELRRDYGLASPKKYRAMRSLVSLDGRIRNALVYCGAGRSGRWTSSGVQFQNVPGGIKDPAAQAAAIEAIKTRDLNWLDALYGDPLQLLANTIRGAVKATEGRSLLVADYYAIEALVLFWLADELEGLRQFENGEDLYLDFARRLDPGAPNRQLGKCSILGLGYGMGEHRAVSTWEGWGMVVSLEEALKAKKTYRATYKQVVAFWYAIEDAFRRAMVQPGLVIRVGRIKFLRRGPWLLVKLPSGRKLMYYEPRVEGEELCYTGVDGYTKKWTRIKTYGAKLVENICQATARDVMASAMLRLDGAGYEIIFTVHDEIIAESRGGQSLAEFCDLMGTRPAWAQDLPLVAEGWEGERYHK